MSATAGFQSGARPDVDIARVTDADVKRALSEISGGAARPGGVDQSSASAAPDARPRTVGYAAVFYPGTSVSAQALPVKVGVAEERSGIDFPLSLVPTARVEGHIVAPEGISPQTLMVQMIGSNPQGMLLDAFRRAAPTPDGKFSFAGVAPGPYAIVVQAQAPGAPGGRPAGPAGPPRPPTHWARADVTLDGDDISGVTLTLQPGMVVSGRIQLEGAAAPPDLSRVRVNLMPVQAPGEVSVSQMQIQPDASGAFTIPGVAPGKYRLMATLPQTRPDGNAWQLKSCAIHGRDSLDVPIDLREGAENALITFTDRVTELNGSVQDAAGQPAPEYHVVAFARDKTYWTPQSQAHPLGTARRGWEVSDAESAGRRIPDHGGDGHGAGRAVRPGGPGAAVAIRGGRYGRRRREEDAGPAPDRSAALMGGDEPVVAAGIEHAAFTIAVRLVHRLVD